MKAFIIHGTMGYPKENWFPWLKKMLEKEGYEVILPKFPTPENQSLESWMGVFENYLHELDEETIIIGHSLGCPFILSILEKIDKPVKAAFLVAPFYQPIGIPKFDPLNQTFLEKEFDWKKIKENCKSFILFYSDKDPYINPDQPDELQEKLNAKLIYIEDAGHFNSESGYDTFPELFEKITGKTLEE